MWTPALEKLSQCVLVFGQIMIIMAALTWVAILFAIIIAYSRRAYESYRVRKDNMSGRRKEETGQHSTGDGSSKSDA